MTLAPAVPPGRDVIVAPGERGNRRRHRRQPSGAPRGGETLQPLDDHTAGEPFEVPAVRLLPTQHGLRQTELGRLLDRDRVHRSDRGTGRQRPRHRQIPPEQRVLRLGQHPGRIIRPRPGKGIPQRLRPRGTTTAETPLSSQTTTPPTNPNPARHRRPFMLLPPAAPPGQRDPGRRTQGYWSVWDGFDELSRSSAMSGRHHHPVRVPLEQGDHSNGCRTEVLGQSGALRAAVGPTTISLAAPVTPLRQSAKTTQMPPAHRD